jgi:uncharacterized protein YbaA (DUF1428 family)
MSGYVDGYVIPIKKKNIKNYKKMARLGCKSWMSHGALSYFETVGDDIDTKWGKNFRKLCKLKSDETVVFAFVVYKSKAHRNKVNAKVHKDMEKYEDKWKMPFDMKRFTMGGFKTLVSAE